MINKYPTLVWCCSFEEEGLILAQGRRGLSIMMGWVRRQEQLVPCVHSKEAKRDTSWCLAHFLLHAVRDPSLWDGAAPGQSGSSHLSLI